MLKYYYLYRLKRCQRQMDRLAARKEELDHHYRNIVDAGDYIVKNIRETYPQRQADIILMRMKDQLLEAQKYFTSQMGNISVELDEIHSKICKLVADIDR